jgi:adenosylcobinamide-GDP ribazoletransferase
MLSGLLSAIQFMTIIPLGSTRPFDPVRAVPFFPMAGLVIGAGLAMVDGVSGTFWSAGATAAVDIAFLAAISGALHLDGLADTADGLYGRRTPERALEIMKDSRIGAIGMIVTVLCLWLKWAGLKDLADHRLWCLVAVPAYARAAVLFGMRYLPYGRPAGGTGSAFFEKPMRPAHFWGLIPLLLLSFLTGWQALTLNVAFALLVSAILIFYRRRMGCVTGDMLGAMIEICEAALFLFLAAGEGR